MQKNIENAWLIERGDSEVSRPLYWAGIDSWSYDNLKAIRFCRKIDAENVLIINWPVRVCEHSWS